MLEGLRCLGARPWVSALMLTGFVAVTAGPTVLRDPKGIGADFFVYWAAAEVARGGQNPYDSALVSQAARGADLKTNGMPYLYPPLLVQLVSPLAPLGPAGSLAAWNAFLLLALVSLLFGCVQLVQGPAASERGGRHALLVHALVVAVGLTWFQVENLRLGQANVLVAALLVLGVRAFENRRDATGAVFLAAAVLLKVTPLVLLAYLFHRRNRRAALFTAVALGLIIVLSLLLPRGFALWRDYLCFLPSAGLGMRPEGHIPLEWPFNLSIPALWVRLFPALTPPAAAILSYAALGGLAVFAFLKAEQVREQDAAAPVWMPYLFLAALASPMVWSVHMTLCLPAILWIFHHGLKTALPAWHLALTAGLFYALSAGWERTFFQHRLWSGPWVQRALSSLPALAFLALFFLAVWGMTHAVRKDPDGGFPSGAIPRSGTTPNG